MNGKPKTRPTVTSKIKGKPTPLLKKSRTEEQKLQDILKQNQRVISPKGMASAEAAAKKAIEKKYPGMFVPNTRTTSGVKKK